MNRAPDVMFICISESIDFNVLIILHVFHIFIQIHSLCSSERSLSFTCSSSFKHNNTEIYVLSQLANVRPLSVIFWKMQFLREKSVYLLSSWDLTTTNCR